MPRTSALLLLNGQSFIQVIQNEINLYKNLEHRHIVGYIATHMDMEQGLMHIFLEYVPGGSIASMLNRFGTFSETLVRNYTQQLLFGLEYLHACHIAHRDLVRAPMQ